MKARRLLIVVLGAGAVGYGLARRRKAAQERSLSTATVGSSGGSSLGVVEVETETIDADGNLVVDDILVAVDDDGTVVATDETIAVITPAGDTVIDETLSVLGDDGELHAVKKTFLSLRASRAPKVSASRRATRFERGKVGLVEEAGHHVDHECHDYGTEQVRQQRM